MAPRHRTIVGATLVGVAAVGLGAWVLLDSEADGDRSAVLLRAEEVVHLHGVGRNPADGSIYLATHAGLVRPVEDGYEVIAGRYQDTMGFTIAGPDDFLASGHPDIREGGPSHLGLIRSTDRGETWSTSSLAGEADFHAIVLAHGQVYAADSMSGSILISTDHGSTWDRRGQIELTTLAVDPDDPLHLVGADYDGLVHASSDGGETWAATDGPPAAALLWHPQLGLLGAGPDGVVSARSDDGRWEEISSLGGTGPVLSIDGDALLAATDGGRILRSIDGWTWEEVQTQDP